MDHELGRDSDRPKAKMGTDSFRRTAGEGCAEVHVPLGEV